jgi:hypothetical protein
VDTALTLLLVAFRYPFVSHRQGIGQVAPVLVQQQAASRGGRVVVGMVDRDKKFAQAPELAKFQPIPGRHGGRGASTRFCSTRSYPTSTLSC